MNMETGQGLGTRVVARKGCQYVNILSANLIGILYIDNYVIDEVNLSKKYSIQYAVRCLV